MTAHQVSPVAEPPIDEPGMFVGRVAELLGGTAFASIDESAAAEAPKHTTVPFAHASECEFARILDFYRIEWAYEPRTFHVRWDATGRPIESFTPDFYLPELELFIELTTLRQRLVTKKNRKLRLVKELYPDINIKLLYNRDMKSLMAKYGSVPSRGELALGNADMEEARLSPK